MLLWRGLIEGRESCTHALEEKERKKWEQTPERLGTESNRFMGSARIPSLFGSTELMRRIPRSLASLPRRQRQKDSKTKIGNRKKGKNERGPIQLGNDRLVFFLFLGCHEPFRANDGLPDRADHCLDRGHDLTKGIGGRERFRGLFGGRHQPGNAVVQTPLQGSEFGIPL